MTGDPIPLRSVEVVQSSDPPECGRCGREAILSARVPHNLVNARNETVKGDTTVVLCPRCDIGRPEAGAPITWFTVNAKITDENLMEAAELIHAWASAARVPVLNEAALEAEFKAWREGGL
ncbi:DUF6300 family protein [Sphaerisporangium sp. NPDC051011]|uniref:DUF6300 family protein n=1 Tax=Sphaerisporangium sp. NPDC051011 TaxID=3155792 RepID=UPI0033DBB3EE